MDINDVRGIITAVLLVAFIGLVVWAYSRKRKRDFDEAARLPFADDTRPRPARADEAERSSK